MTVATSTRIAHRSTLRNDLRIALPPANFSFTQDEEWCVVRVNDEWREIRLHDYDELFAVPGLYEHLIYDILKCDSPARIRKLFEAELAARRHTGNRTAERWTLVLETAWLARNLLTWASSS